MLGEREDLITEHILTLVARTLTRNTKNNLPLSFNVAKNGKVLENKIKQVAGTLGSL